MAKLIQFKRYEDERGVLVPIEGERDVPFAVKRRWVIKNVPEGETRGNHAHRNTNQVIIAIEGAFQVQIVRPDESEAERMLKNQPPSSRFSWYILDRDNVGLCVEPGEWILLLDFSPGAICEVLADTYYDEEDYIT